MEPNSLFQQNTLVTYFIFGGVNREILEVSDACGPSRDA